MDYPDSASVAAWQDTRRQEQACSKLTVDQIPRLLRKTCNLPVPTVIAHGKLSSYVRYQLSPCPNKLSSVTHSTHPPARAASSRLFGTASFFPACIDEVTPRLRNSDTPLPLPILTMGFGPTIAWKASPTRIPPPICTSTPFPKPRWS